MRHWFVLILLLLAASGRAAPITSEPVAAFLDEHCFSCHDDLDAKGDLDLTAMPEAITTEADAQLWMKVLDQLQADLMPPLKKKRPEPRQRAMVIRAIEKHVTESNFADAYLRKLLRPEYGNYTDHDMLFSGAINDAPFTPARLWRMSPEIYAARFGRAAAQSNPYVYPTRDNGFRDYAATSNVDQSTVESIIVATNKKLEDDLFGVTGGVKKIISFNQGQNKTQTVKPNPAHRYAPYLKPDTPSAEQMNRLIDEEFKIVHRREPTDAERDKYLGFLQANIYEAGNLEAMKATVLAIRLSPEAIYRMEVGAGPIDEHGRRRLSENEIANTLAFALTDQGPDQNQPIAEALARGELNNAAGVRATVLTMLDRPDRINLRSGAANLKFFAANPRVPRFFQEYFGYHHTPGVFKDDGRRMLEFGVRYPGAPIENNLVRDLDNLILLILRRDQNVLRELLTTDRFLINHPGDNDLMRECYAEFMRQIRDDTFKNKRITNEVINALKRDVNPHPGTGQQIAQALAYNLPYGPGSYRQVWNYQIEQPVQLPNRMGVLTHPAWLWAHSTNFDNDPVHRGIWVQTKLLAGVIADVPPNVDARVPEDPHKTLRQRLNVIREKDCWKCHVKINPLGEPFEIFDDWGRYRTEHYFNADRELVTRRDQTFDQQLEAGTLKTKPIDATGELRGAGSAEGAGADLDGPVTDAFDMIERLAQSNRVRQSFVRHAFRYFMGRNEMLSDSQTLIAADRAYLESGGSFKALVAYAAHF
jgi:hypothetical protein